MIMIASLSQIVTIGIMLSQIANISYNPALKYDAQMSKRLQLLGDFVSQTPYRGSAPGRRWGTDPSVSLTSKSWLRHCIVKLRKIWQILCNLDFADDVMLIYGNIESTFRKQKATSISCNFIPLILGCEERERAVIVFQWTMGLLNVYEAAWTVFFGNSKPYDALRQPHSKAYTAKHSKERQDVSSSSFLACNSGLRSVIRRHHHPQSQICCFWERKVVLFQIPLDGAEPRDAGTRSSPVCRRGG